MGTIPKVSLVRFSVGQLYLGLCVTSPPGGVYVGEVLPLSASTLFGQRGVHACNHTRSSSQRIQRAIFHHAGIRPRRQLRWSRYQVIVGCNRLVPLQRCVLSQFRCRPAHGSPRQAIPEHKASHLREHRTKQTDKHNQEHSDCSHAPLLLATSSALGPRSKQARSFRSPYVHTP